MIAPNNWQRELGESNRLALAQTILANEVEERLAASEARLREKFRVVVWIHKFRHVLVVTSPLMKRTCITSRCLAIQQVFTHQNRSRQQSELKAIPPLSLVTIFIFIFIVIAVVIAILPSIAFRLELLLLLLLKLSKTH